MTGPMVRFARRWELARLGLFVLMYLMAAPFLVHTVEMVRAGDSGEAAGKSYLFVAGGTLGNTAMVVHMAAGVVLFALVPLQLVSTIRRRFTSFHRATGVLLVGLASLTSLGGLIFIAVRGTIGGPVMSFGFALYGVCMLVAAVRMLQTALQHNRIGHWKWSIRFFWLAIGSWLYRLHYVLWYLITGGVWSEPDFSGGFDKMQNFAFYVPYLVFVQIWIVYRSPARLRQRFY